MVLMTQALRRCQVDDSGVRLVAQLLPQLEVRTMGYAMVCSTSAWRWENPLDHTEQPSLCVGAT